MPLFAMRLHVRQENFDALHRAHEVDADDPAPVAQRHALGEASARDARVVAEDMHLAKGGHRLRGGALKRLAARNVAHRAFDAWAMIGETCKSRRQRWLLDVGEHDVHAFGKERACEREPDAAGTTGDECGLAGERLHPSTARILAWRGREGFADSYGAASSAARPWRLRARRASRSGEAARRRWFRLRGSAVDRAPTH
jgi:hypothetical protein